ncbi:hypothetical protein AVEN_128220-1 [Araneus ventricosus]|uniref:MADF domain-containing protein n=1 Tax=Araneus ventricosus TaxID=182803 RepID=A0A4Y2A071_ARAVE|nr:hypothetical protein AVEN_128220-1 [Araneus ventricosus]
MTSCAERISAHRGCGRSLVLFTSAEDERLVKLISQFPCVYDASSPLYKDLTVQDSAWSVIAEFVGRSVEDSKERWRGIEDEYQKWQIREKITGSSAASKGQKWPLADSLVFLNKVDHERKSVSSVQSGEIQSKEETVSRRRSPTSSTPYSKDLQTQNVESTLIFKRPRKRARKSKKILELLDSPRMERKKTHKRMAGDKYVDDDIDLFFKQIANSVKNLSPEFIYEAKMRSLEMVIDLTNRKLLLFNFPQEHSALASTYSPSVTSSSSTVDNTSSSTVDNQRIEV